MWTLMKRAILILKQERTGFTNKIEQEKEKKIYELQPGN